jgi:hypothetical protein
MDAIQAARRAMRLRGIECLQSYQPVWNENPRVFRKTPLHHGADAFRYLAMTWRPQKLDEEKPDPINELLKPLTWNGVWDVHVHEQIERGADPDDFMTELRN